MDVHTLLSACPRGAFFFRKMLYHVCVMDVTHNNNGIFISCTTREHIFYTVRRDSTWKGRGMDDVESVDSLIGKYQQYYLYNKEGKGPAPAGGICLGRITYNPNLPNFRGVSGCCLL